MIDNHRISMELTDTFGVDVAVIVPVVVAVVVIVVVMFEWLFVNSL